MTRFGGEPIAGIREQPRFSLHGLLGGADMWENLHNRLSSGEGGLPKSDGLT